MIQALKDRLGMTEAVEQVKEQLADEYDNYPKGIEKVRLDTRDSFGWTVNVHLTEPLDWNVMEEVADDMGLESEIGDDGNRFGFYDTVEDDDGNEIMKAASGSVRNDRPAIVHPEPADDTEHFRNEVLVRYLNRRYGQESG